MNNTALNILIHISWCIFASFSRGLLFKWGPWASSIDITWLICQKSRLRPQTYCIRIYIIRSLGQSHVLRPVRIFLEVVMLGHELGITLTLLDTAKGFSKVVVPTDTPTSREWVFPWLHNAHYLYIYLVISASLVSVNGTHCDFNLHFPRMRIFFSK